MTSNDSCIRVCMYALVTQSIVFGRWLKENKMKLLVRSHEMKEEGYDVQVR